MHNAPTLFDLGPSPVPEIPRKAQRDRAEVHADAVVMDRYERVLRNAGPVLSRFVGAEITAEYERRHGKLSLSDSRGLGGLYARLLKQGVIVKTGQSRPRVNGCPAAEYSFVK